MLGLAPKNIRNATFRGNPDYALVSFDQLSQVLKETLRDLTRDPDFYGIFLPQGNTGLTIKSACRATAQLYLTLSEPGKLSARVKAKLGGRCDETIARLVLDGVLQIEHDHNFVGGADAFDVIYESIPSPLIQGRLGDLSIRALKYAQCLNLDDSVKLSARLYFYNRIPASPALRGQFPSSESVIEHLEIDGRGATASSLEEGWSRRKVSSAYDGWFVWESRVLSLRPPQSASTYKLYVSPAYTHIREVFQTTVSVLRRARVPRFKVGKDLYGILRPDKIVLYFSDEKELQTISDLLLERLRGCPAHGTPFTAEIGGDGLLSWGMDPPRDQHAISWQERESWRLWITNRLAVALQAAKNSRSHTAEPWKYALARLRLEGIDTNTWTPVNAGLGQGPSEERGRG